ncbi:hypothetical protein OGAPHI_004018 [Ogataea philodendri]|uniref:Uncharacterized protein n=1 Tax=Ogataea philodendri TaxID=1378263 RepID=A0A9P8P6A1_9ASCO|nr:uncharacterized protein OGAPHI_004018 [Ogataea philodendri]KAH3665830.1 hypothetical protein OGAPHI_004018 [Ogataea philodendri]
MMMGDHIAEQMNLEASAGERGSPVSGSTRVLSTTIRNGSRRDVVKSGMASVAHNNEAHTRTARQFFCCGLSNGEKLSSVTVTMAMKRILNALPDKTGAGMVILRPAPRWISNFSIGAAPTSATTDFCTRAACDLRSIPIMFLQTVFLSQTMYSLRFERSSSLADSSLPAVNTE